MDQQGLMFEAHLGYSRVIQLIYHDYASATRTEVWPNLRKSINEPTLSRSLPFADRPNSKKARCGFPRGLKRFLTNLTHARSKLHSRPDTLTLFDIVTLNYATVRKHASRASIRCEDSALGSSTSSLTASSKPKTTARPHNIRRMPRMADRVVDVRLESVYDGGETCGGYVFASALQDAWHAQDIEKLGARS
ncbi:hypothetical protein FRC11_001863 [Ceratobasidium sp. 423]|nr:hypothetical protein FRC11_001863 [Ceratobasidium sp. 423]